MNKAILSAIMLLFFFLSANAQTKTTFYGVVKNPDKKKVPYALLSIPELGLSSACNEKGEFSILVPQGKYEFVVSSVGYETSKEWILIEATTKQRHDFICKDKFIELESVIVQARKHSEDMQKVPISITGLSSRFLKDVGLQSVNDLPFYVPNLNQLASGSYTLFVIRGINSISITDPAVGVYVDGIPYNGYALNSEMFDAKKIEILRGPQGTLFGRNTMGGVINIETKSPTNEINGYAEANIGSFGLQKYGLSLSCPILKDRLYIKGGFVYDKMNGYGENTTLQTKTYGYEKIQGNFCMLYKISPSWIANLHGTIEKDRFPNAFAYALNPEQAFANPYKVKMNRPADFCQNQQSATLAVKHKGKFLNFSSTTTFQHQDLFYSKDGDSDYTDADMMTWNTYNGKKLPYSIFSQELKLSSAQQQKTKWLVGAFIFREDMEENYTYKYHKDYATIDPNAPYEMSTISSKQNNGYAFFGQISHSLTNALSATLGIRYDHEQRELTTRSEMVKASNPPQTTLPETSVNGKYHSWSPKLSLEYKITNDKMLYASYARGFRSGGLNAYTSNPEHLKYNPEYTNNYEVGIKTQWWNNRLRANMSLFYIEWKDQVVSGIDSKTMSFIYINAGEVKSKGIEYEMTLLPFSGLQLDWNFAYTDAVYKKLPLFDFVTRKTVDKSGNTPIQTPRFSTMLSAQYKRPLTILSTPIYALIRMEYKHTGSQYFNLANSIKQDKYDVINIRIGMECTNCGIYLWGKNLTNNKHLVFAHPFGPSVCKLDMPRIFGLTLIGKF